MGSFYRKSYLSPDNTLQWVKAGQKNSLRVRPPSPYTYSRDFRKSSDYAFAITSGFLNGRPHIDTEMYNKVRSRLNDRIGPRALWWANLIESRQTFNGLGAACEKIGLAAMYTRKGIQAARRGDHAAAKRRFKEAKRVLGVGSLKQFNDTAAGVTLAMNWCLIPVTKDVCNTWDLIRKDLKEPQVVRASLRRKFVEDWHGGRRPFEPPWEECTYVVTYRMKAAFVVSNPTLFKLAQAGLTDPLGTLWELTPFSFVVDWFVNVQEIISALSEYSGLRFTECSLSKKINSKKVIHTWPDGQEWWADGVWYDRSIHPEPPRPGVLITSPFGGAVRTLNQLAFAITQTKNLRT